MKNVSGFSRCGLDVATVNRIFPRPSQLAGNVQTRLVSGYALRHTVIRPKMYPTLAVAGSMLPLSTAFSREPHESRATSRLDWYQGMPSGIP